MFSEQQESEQEQTQQEDEEIEEERSFLGFCSFCVVRFVLTSNLSIEISFFLF